MVSFMWIITLNQKQNYSWCGDYSWTWVNISISHGFKRGIDYGESNRYSDKNAFNFVKCLQDW